MNKDSKVRPKIIRIGPGDRLLLVLLSLVFIVGFGSAYYALTEWLPSDTFGRAVKFVGRELSLTLLLFAFLVITRCFISTPELERKLASITLKILVAMTLLGCALTALFFLALVLS